MLTKTYTGDTPKQILKAAMEDKEAYFPRKVRKAAHKIIKSKEWDFFETGSGLIFAKPEPKSNIVFVFLNEENGYVIVPCTREEVISICTK